MLGHVIFGDYDFGETFFCHTPRIMRPNIKTQEVSVAGRDGSYYQSSRYQPVDIECLMVLLDNKGDNGYMAEVLDQVSKQLKPRVDKLYLPSDDGRYYLAVPSGTSTVDEFVTSARLRVTFRACDPFRYGIERSGNLAAQTNKEITVGGNAPARPIITATPSSSTSYYEVTNRTTGESVRLYANKIDNADNWNGNETIVIDMKEQIATVNGQTWAVSLNSDYWDMEDVVSLRANGASTVEWREVWL